MRLAGRFWMVAYGSQINTVLRLVLCLIGLLTGAQLLYFVIVWTVTQIVGSLVILVLAFIEIEQRVHRLLSRIAHRHIDALQGPLDFYDRQQYRAYSALKRK